MTSIAKWNTPSAWTSAGFTAADFNALASGSAAVAASAIANGTALDMNVVVSFALTVGGTTTTSSYLALCVLPLNQDGTTYGDGSATGATPPAAQYQRSVVGVKSGVTSGGVLTGTFPPIEMPPTDFKLAIVNNLGVPLNAAAAAAIQYRAFDINLNG